MRWDSQGHIEEEEHYFLSCFSEKMPTSPNARFCLFLDKFDNCRVQFTVERSPGGKLKVTALTIKGRPLSTLFLTKKIGVQFTYSVKKLK